MHRFVVILVVTLILLSVKTVSTAPIGLKCPWGPGESWKSNGSYYDQGKHTGSDSYCVDFNWSKDVNPSGSDDNGKPVFAPAGGEIILSDWSDSYGWNVKIDHGNGITTHYAHLSQRPFVGVGENVLVGQVIGTCGGTPNYSPHLHFGIFNNGQSVQPDPLDGQSMEPDKSFLSSNSNILNLEYIANGGRSQFGSLQNGVGQDTTTGIHWYHAYDPGSLYRGGQVPNNCYVQNWGGGPYANCGIVYDALGGARRAYTVRTGFWYNGQSGPGQGWAKQGGPTSWLGMPISDEIVNPSGFAEQFFVGGYYRWMGACQANYWNVCSPGWTSYGWDPVFSYQVAEAWVAAGNIWGIGQPTGYAYQDGYNWKQPCLNGIIQVEIPSGQVSGAGGSSESFSGLTLTPIAGDWDGDAVFEVGVYVQEENNFYLDTDNDGYTDLTIGMGASGDIPIVGDWDGDGDFTIGVYRPSTRRFYLDYNNDRVADLELNYGDPGDLPVVGDWDGNGTTTIGIYRPSSRTFWLDYNNDGTADLGRTYGDYNDTPVVGDWDGNGTTTIGIYRPSTRTFWLDFDNNGVADLSRTYGDMWDVPVVGDWDGNGTVTIGIFRPSDRYFWLDYNNDGTADRGFEIKRQIGTFKVVPGNNLSTLPLTFSLSQNYPNPFNPVTTISYSLPTATHVSLDIYNILGQKVATLVNEKQEAGEHQVQFDCSTCASGIYLYRISTDQATESRKMLLLK